MEKECEPNHFLSCKKSDIGELSASKIAVSLSEKIIELPETLYATQVWHKQSLSGDS
jgi:hypothetical protein